MPRVMPEDLMNTVIAADALRRRALGMAPARYKRWQRTWIEPFFNLLGMGLGQLMLISPWFIRRRLDPWICQKMGGHAPEENPRLPQVIEQSVRLAQELKRKTGQWPAVLVLTSHPETVGPLEWLRFELLRQSMLIAHGVAEAHRPHALYRPSPRCFLAIDPYALDTVSPLVGGFYAAWMHRIYLAWDRQPSTQSWIQRHLFLRRTGYDRVTWRLLRTLNANVPVLMVLSGGLPYNARLLYAAREFVQRLKLPRWPFPKLAAAKRLIEILMRPAGGAWPAESGVIPSATRQEIQSFFATLGVPEGPWDALIRSFEEGFRLSVPVRARLFRLLLGRIAAQGKPLLLVGVDHAGTAPHVRLSEPWGVDQDSDAETLARSFARFFASPS